MVEVDSLFEDKSAHALPEIPLAIQVKNGMLHFKTESDFDAVADYLIRNQEDGSLDEFETKSPSISFFTYRI